ncbi:hypothetical protein K443DRAFT_679685 [Laccaria amethystina LaAM-08-1]|uniref:Uncharacterized protein n=1 Tax=Laccaria amethystina LaAM-08-1 TaxID=1095629 RepID=A0A0C9XUZ3_9AGAR|nr:hypothetical protein K443DRAFT_679685 [Laccaria amethystina LaAM-08-1]
MRWHNQVVLIHECVASVRVVPDEVGDDGSDGVWSVFRILSYRIRDFEEQHSRGIYNPQSLDGSDVGGGDVIGFWRV